MYLLLFARLLLVIGGINYLFKSTINVDLFTLIKYPFIVNIISLLIGLSALYFIFNRDYYLPFLGESVIPIGDKKPTENLTKIKLSGLPPNTIVMAWGAQSDTKIYEDPFEAYGSYSNTEITQTNENGEVTIELPCPSEYYVNKFGIMKRKLKRHIHYRYQLPKYKGLFSKVYTKYLDEKCQ
jgi:uncharacterized membrane protein YuzA (DUF378 family)